MTTKTKRLILNINDGLYSQLQKLSEINGLSMAGQIRYLVSQATKDN